MQKKTGRERTFKQALIHNLRHFFRKNPDSIFRKVRGVIHVGANTGQEIGLYAKYGLEVVWIEPIPEIYEKLRSNLSGISGQVALSGLVTDSNNKSYDFHIANNEGASSSILEFNLHQDIWPGINFNKTIKLYSKTLPTILRDNQISLPAYDMLVMDTQGSELLILKGALPILENFIYIKTEVPDFESYTGCCQLKDLHLFLSNQGYAEYSRVKFASHPNGGNYYDIIYKKAKPGIK
jgi:FkbM family methyltransferase